MNIQWEHIDKPTSNRLYSGHYGVYVIVQIFGSEFHVKYIGQGILSDRINLHLDYKNEPNDCLARVMSDINHVRIYSTKIDNSVERNNAEFSLYIYYFNNGHNLCNKNTPPGNLIEITLPIIKKE